MLLSQACPAEAPDAHRHHDCRACWLRLEGHRQVPHRPLLHRNHGRPGTLLGEGEGVAIPTTETRFTPTWSRTVPGFRLRSAVIQGPRTAGVSGREHLSPNPRGVCRGNLGPSSLAGEVQHLQFHPECPSSPLWGRAGRKPRARVQLCPLRGDSEWPFLTTTLDALLELCGLTGSGGSLCAWRKLWLPCAPG